MGGHGCAHRRRSVALVVAYAEPHGRDTDHGPIPIAIPRRTVGAPLPGAATRGTPRAIALGEDTSARQSAHPQQVTDA